MAKPPPQPNTRKHIKTFRPNDCNNNFEIHRSLCFCVWNIFVFRFPARETIVLLLLPPPAALLYAHRHRSAADIPSKIYFVCRRQTAMWDFKYENSINVFRSLGYSTLKIESKASFQRIKTKAMIRKSSSTWGRSGARGKNETSVLEDRSSAKID